MFKLGGFIVVSLIWFYFRDITYPRYAFFAVSLFFLMVLTEHLFGKKIFELTDDKLR